MNTQQSTDFQAILAKMSAQRKELDAQIALLEKDVRVFHHTLSSLLDKQSVKRVLEKIVDSTPHI